MKYLTSLLCALWASVALAQTNFRAGWEADNPVPKEAKLSFSAKENAHQAYLEKARQAANPLHQLYGQLYLVYDYLDAQDYTNATRWLLKADSLATSSGNRGWQGWVAHRKGIIALRLGNYEASRQAYTQAAALCGEAGDSLCLAESLEQMSLTSGELNDFEQANRYHLLAMPLIEKYGGLAPLACALNNYGTICAWQGRVAEAVPYYERAIALYRQLGLQQETTKAMNNLAGNYRQLRYYDRAKSILDSCVRINQALGLPEHLMFNYVNLSSLYDSLGDYRQAFRYLLQYNALHDSISGAEIQQKINELEIKYQSQQKELELEKSKLALESARRSLVWRTAILLFGLLLAGVGLWRWRLQNRFARQETSRNKEALDDMTRLLLEKNTQLAAMNTAAQNFTAGDSQATEPADERNLFENRILTEADWAAFKIYFEKAHPGYLLRLRSNYPALSEGEERLFLFIKLNLTTKEAAAILGISAESVKKARNRLRKKIELGEEVLLEEFIRGF